MFLNNFLSFYKNNTHSIRFLFSFITLLMKSKKNHLTNNQLLEQKDKKVFILNLMI